MLKEIAFGESIESIRALTDVEFTVADYLSYTEDNFSEYDPSKVKERDE